MSWDVALLRTEYRTVASIPRDHKPGPIEDRAALIAVLTRSFAGLDARDPSWLLLDGPDWSIEISLGDSDPIEVITLHVRGADEVLQVIRNLCEVLGTKAIDYSTGEFIDFDGDPGRGLRGWRALLARATGKS